MCAFRVVIQNMRACTRSLYHSECVPLSPVYPSHSLFPPCSILHISLSVRTYSIINFSILCTTNTRSMRMKNYYDYYARPTTNATEPLSRLGVSVHTRAHSATKTKSKKIAHKAHEFMIVKGAEMESVDSRRVRSQRKVPTSKKIIIIYALMLVCISTERHSIAR